MKHLIPILLLGVFLQNVSTQERDDQCLNICSNSLLDIRGPQGPPGAPGMSGPVGSQGEPGVKGQSGRPGKVGPQGPKGEIGHNGTDGVGIEGEKGTKGDTGLAGMKGTKGNSGVNGLTGPKGNTGSSGQKGKKGERPDFVKVAFSVDRTSSLRGASSDQVITYTNTILDENADIDLDTGVFTCTAPGIYYFSFNFWNRSSKSLFIQLKLNNLMKFQFRMTSQSNMYQQQSNSGMLRLNRNDQVKLVLVRGENYGFSNGSGYNIFSGYLVYPD